MKSIILLAAGILLAYTSGIAQLKNTKTENVKVYGNCAMCETGIEKAGNIKNTAEVNWNKDTKLAVVSYDAKKTNPNEVLKRIALAGYDSEAFLAPDDAYAKLPECCQYNRPEKMMVKTASSSEHAAHLMGLSAEVQKPATFTSLYNEYFALKDALVKSDGVTAAATAEQMMKTVKAVDMKSLKPQEHDVWMKVMSDISEDAEHISATKDAGHQRDHFATLSKSMYTLIKVSKASTTVYYQHCPMASGGKGANWLSKENTIKNPYYGSKMLTCGSTEETIN